MKNNMQLKACDLALGSVISLSCLEDYSCYALNSQYSNFFIIAFSVCAPCSYGLFNSACTILHTYVNSPHVEFIVHIKKVDKDIDFTTYIDDS